MSRTSTHDNANAVMRRAGERTPARDSFPPLGHFIDGAFHTTAAETIALIDPSTGGTVAEVPSGTRADVDRAAAAARAAFADWGRTTPRERADLLLEIASRVEARADEFARLESLDTGKPRTVAADDVQGTVDVFRFAAGAGRAFTEAGAAEYVRDHTSILLREPVGVVGAIVPWNYPLLMAAWKIAPILAVGDTVIVKPAEQTPLTLLLLADVVRDLLPAGVFNVVLGIGPVVGAALAEHPQIDLVAVTGSVGSGRAGAAAAADSVKRVHLELGGKAPVVIFEDADLEAAAEALRTAGYWNSGQECGAGTRVLVHESVADRFVELLAEQVGAIAVGEPGAGDDIEVGPLISQAQLDRVRGFVERAEGEGARAVVGGRALPGPGFFLAPTVLVDVEQGTEASREEIFGPVITVETFQDEEEAVTRANDVVYGLAASVWTTNAARSLDVPRRLDFGTVWVNSHLVLASEVPWGGFKGSGYGRDLSVYALQDFSRTKHIQLNHAR
ncbi:aldehyde dehydrogenase family protein [Saccharopolyspora sp. 6V]|uniref:aldehyde dehydrogenase family protein n=1 Tax=Saccharopolyspora sp. 6V TaxID=2877239 RepID=UPI001CD19D8B|nr:aldehyde dehydrogenase family protein [Saccharopolyspora sp. 6V]MCA1190718.1 aldehyde dehydrogenase family protein [Saccharopolyspora sp. 6V]